jgi:hypothetical protein
MTKPVLVREAVLVQDDTVLDALLENAQKQFNLLAARHELADRQLRLALKAMNIHPFTDESVQEYRQWLAQTMISASTRFNQKAVYCVRLTLAVSVIVTIFILTRMHNIPSSPTIVWKVSLGLSLLVAIVTGLIVSIWKVEYPEWCEKESSHYSFEIPVPLLQMITELHHKCPSLRVYIDQLYLPEGKWGTAFLIAYPSWDDSRKHYLSVWNEPKLDPDQEL